MLRETITLSPSTETQILIKAIILIIVVSITLKAIASSKHWPHIHPT